MRYGMVAGLVVAIMAGAAWGQEKPGVDIVSGNNKFAGELYGKVRAQEGNLFLSPYSISTALAMTYAGANGQTRTQMASVLHLPDINLRRALAGTYDKMLHGAFGKLIADLNARSKAGKDYELSTANALWAQKGFAFRKEYTDLVKEYYGAGLENVDFAKANDAARNTINAWVEEETKGKIKDLLKAPDPKPDTKLVLTNAIYFKGQWETAFDKKLTTDEPFQTGADKARYNRPAIPMMHRTGLFGYADKDGVQMLELPYKGKDLAMYVFLPRDVNGFAKMEEQIGAGKVEEWLTVDTKMLREGDWSEQEMAVSLPRFKMTSEFELGKALVEMGMKDAFDVMAADFSGMTGKSDLYISKVIHKAFVDVNEEGTEAAAATAVIMAPKGAMPRQPLVFKADHPFFFIIRDQKTASTLFMGRVMDPAAK